MTRDEILTVATHTRHDFETKSLELHHLQSLVEKHLPYIADTYKSNLSIWIEQTLSSFPVNGCELASALLVDRLQTGKIIYGRYEYEPIGPHNIRKSHSFWVQTEYNSNSPLIVDITADQYGGPPIYVGDLIHPWTIPDWSAIS